MQIWDYLIIAGVVGWLVWLVVRSVRQKGRGQCSGCCSSCRFNDCAASSAKPNNQSSTSSHQPVQGHP